MSEPVRYEHAERVRDFYRDQGKASERTRIVALLMELDVIRRCGVTNKLVAVDTDGKKVVYLTGVEDA